MYVGCGAGFGGDRPLAALKLLQRVEEINYLVLECLAERTLADRWLSMSSGGDGYDPRGMCSRFDMFFITFKKVSLLFYLTVSEWMRLLLPLAVEKGTCIITNMGASMISSPSFLPLCSFFFLYILYCSVLVVDPLGAQKKVLEVATELGLTISVAVAHEVHFETGTNRVLLYILSSLKLHSVFACVSLSNLWL